MTRVTVAMPVYNGMPHLREAVDSILAQTFRDFLLVVVDDCSSDETVKYLESLKDPRIQIHKNDERQGQGAARNTVLEHCRTEYLAFADADDISFPERFESQVRYLDGNPEIGMLGTHFTFLASNGQRGMTPSLALDHDGIRRDLLLGRHAVANFTLLFRTQTLRDVKGFRIDGAGEDWDLFLRVTEETQAANLPDVLCSYRIHATSTTIKQALTLQRRYAHACECAELRGSDARETTFEEFCLRQEARPLHARLGAKLSLLSGLYYRRAIAELLEGKKLRGYSRLACAALMSPQRLRQRVSRELRDRRISSQHAPS